MKAMSTMPAQRALAGHGGRRRRDAGVRRPARRTSPIDATRAALGLGLLVASISGAAQAATITVATTADTSAVQCTLRDAITAANANAASGACPAGAGASDVLELASLSGTIALGSALPSIATPMTLHGPGAAALTVDGANAFRVLDVFAFAGAAAVSGLTLAHGHCVQGCGIRNDGTLALDGVTVDHNVASVTGGTNAFPEAGGIANSGTLTMTNGTVSSNSASATGATSQNSPQGGGIYNQGGATLTLDRSTVRGNDATAAAGAGGTSNANGGGIDNFGTLHVLRSTISANTVSATSTVFNSASGGGLGNANSPGVNVTIDDSTVAGNSAVVSGPGNPSAAGGFNVFGTSFAVTSSTIAGNAAATGANVVGGAPMTIRSSIISSPQGGGGNCVGAITSQGHNLTDGTGCGLTAPGDLLSTDPLFDPAGLADNGGPTQTIALTAASPAIDQGQSSAGEALDQRGLARPVDVATVANAATGDGADIGAFEVQIAPVAPPADPPVDPPAGGGGGGGVAPPPTGTPPPPTGTPPPPTALTFSGLALSPSHFRSATRLTYALSAAAVVTLRAEIASAGRRVGGRCAAPTRASRTHRACHRYRPVPGSLTATGVAGINHLRFGGRLGGHRLRPGSYRLLAQATWPSGKRSPVIRLAFRVRRP